jgi:predicted DNA-binding transcriptional regulator YafY
LQNVAPSVVTSARFDIKRTRWQRCRACAFSLPLPSVDAAGNALAKIAAVLPADLRASLEASTLLIGPGDPLPPMTVDLTVIREAIRTERKLHLAYRDEAGKTSERVIWPFALGFFERVRMVVAWCELRDGFRHFRADRIESMTVSEARYPRGRRTLLKAWRETTGRQ